MKRLDFFARAGIAIAVISCYALSTAPAAYAARLPTDRSSRVVAALRDATGCRGWQRFTAVKIHGTHAGGGLDGTCASTEGVRFRLLSMQAVTSFSRRKPRVRSISIREEPTIA